RFFGDDFILMKKREVIDKKLFGNGEEHPCFRSMLGDYLAVATGDLTVFNTEWEAAKFKSVHAGLTEAEMTVPLIVIE
ncbi:MAG: phosphodiesterase, partial [Clostridia bacterium]|nr:phosphodiesterase [Clostridia bacterium]